jgi:hypothetical protein
VVLTTNSILTRAGSRQRSGSRYPTSQPTTNLCFQLTDGPELGPWLATNYGPKSAILAKKRQGKPATILGCILCAHRIPNNEILSKNADRGPVSKMR